MGPRIVFGVGCTLSLIVIPPPILRAQSALPHHPEPQQSLPDAPSAVRPLPEHPKSHAAGVTEAESSVDEAWPRKAVRGDETISMYQPQLEAWKGDEMHAYAA